MTAECKIAALTPLQPGVPWPTEDPYLFCVHHDDQYPEGTADLGPAAPLDGRDLGMDFSRKDGWSMYHGQVVPGFPRHPHRGFETVTVVRQGLVDHADSLGAAARYGQGDVQWLTAGSGINHSEMFPLLNAERPNPMDFFQIWLNLPSENKFVTPYFSMFWGEQVPKLRLQDKGRREVEITIVAGRYHTQPALTPPPDSWAARATSDVAIWLIKLAPDSIWTLPAARENTTRSFYFFSGEDLSFCGEEVKVRHRIKTTNGGEVQLSNGAQTSELLLLQGQPIGEPVARYGPFVMNTREEIRQTFIDYERTQFGGWPWDAVDPVHGDQNLRFARHADGRSERPV